ncbi:fumarate reductase iron-sulfur subunit [Thauera sp. WH-2]|jgi:fumarate reductase iron-sulfur subunit|uniref:fumarate reductase iron-sulfur subunit n=1 Tax=unclassified Thauera TaxID=2609274 RepID=UPI002A3E9A93|nr:fumarate reductase iron-sulfur subunit [Thauera sp.]
MSRRLKLSIFRHNPRDPKSVPRLVDYELDEQPGMTLFIALNAIRDTQAPDLNFDFVCRAGVCGSCAMVIDGRPGLACRTLTSTLPASFSLYPLPVFRLVADLSVDVGSWMRELAERLQTWAHLDGEPDLDCLEARMEPALAEEVYELDRCIECGCCIAACATAQMREGFVGAVGLNKVARFRLDPADTRDDADFYELVGNDAGIFGCMSLLACNDLCPKELSLQTQLAWLRRKMAGQGVRWLRRA